MRRNRIIGIVLLLFIVGASGCSGQSSTPALTLATTTSTRDSGLLEELLPEFKKETGIEVKYVAVGTGQALELGRRGDADVLLVHDPAGERRFVEEGFGVERLPVMYNDFVLVGPETDPAKVRGLASAAEALRRIAQAGDPFVSRGDESGTHQKEKALWKQAGIEPGGAGYLRAGAGMAEVLRLASEKRAYTLTDRATFLAQRPALVLLVERDPLLINRYSVIGVNPKKHPHVRAEAAQRFADFLRSPQTQRRIADFGKQQYGQALFFVGEPSGERSEPEG